MRRKGRRKRGGGNEQIVIVAELIILLLLLIAIVMSVVIFLLLVCVVSRFILVGFHLQIDIEIKIHTYAIHSATLYSLFSTVHGFCFFCC